MTSRFSADAETYARFRPGYPAALVDWIAAASGHSPPAQVADIGCGTGISSRLFAARGYDVIGVDSNQDMLAQARAAAGGPRYLRGEAERTGLPDASVDLVTVAQAFHWFDMPAALAEFRRVLRPGGRCAAFWNVRTSSPFLDAYDVLLRAHSEDYRLLDGHAVTRARLHTAVTGPVAEARFATAMPVDVDGMLGYAHSTSYVAHGVADLPAFDDALRTLVGAHADGAGQVELRFEVLALLFA